MGTQGKPRVGASTARRSPLPTTLEIAVLAGLALVLTASAWMARPVWDDAMMALRELSGFGTSLASEHQDRPVQGLIWQAWQDAGGFWEIGAAVHCAIWFAFGFAAVWLWKLLFPEHARWALAAGCLTIAPVIVSTQTVLINPVLGGTVPIAIVYLAACFLVSSEAPSVLRYVVAGGLVFAAGMITEYPVPAALAAALVIGVGVRSGPFLSLRRWLPSLVLGGVALGSYAVFWKVVAVASARPGVRPEEHFQHDLIWRLKITAPRLLSELWDVGLGSFLTRLGAVQADSNLAVISLLFGLALGGLALWISRRKVVPESHGNESRLGRRLLALAAGLAVGLLPAILFGRQVSAHDWTSSRIGLPVLPIAACATLAAGLALVQPRLRGIAFGAVVVTAGFYTIFTGFGFVRAQQELAGVGEQVRSELPTERPLIIVFERDWADVAGGEPRDYELTARLLSRWSPADRKDVWAFASVGQLDTLLARYSGLAGFERRRFAVGALSAEPQAVAWIVYRDGQARVEESPVSLLRGDVTPRDGQ